jgi:hypothetical protein
MKTTVELPDDLFVAAKKRAVERRTTLRDLIERGLRRELSEPPTSGRPRRPRRIAWVTVDGGLPPGIDVANREELYGWLREER